MIYTSGSTGKPKGVMIEHRSVVNRLHWMQHAYPIDESDVILQKTPYYFDVSVWELFWWALQGAKLCFLMPGGERNPLAIVETIRKHHVSVMHFVPSMLNVFLEYLDGKAAGVLNSLASVRQVFASGEALTPSHVRKFNDILGQQDRRPTDQPLRPHRGDGRRQLISIAPRTMISKPFRSAGRSTTSGFTSSETASRWRSARPESCALPASVWPEAI